MDTWIFSQRSHRVFSQMWRKADPCCTVSSTYRGVEGDGVTVTDTDSEKLLSTHRCRCQVGRQHVSLHFILKALLWRPSMPDTELKLGIDHNFPYGWHAYEVTSLNACDIVASLCLELHPGSLFLSCNIDNIKGDEVNCKCCFDGYSWWSGLNKYFLRCIVQEAQLPQRNSASAAHMEGGWG